MLPRWVLHSDAFVVTTLAPANLLKMRHNICHHAREPESHVSNLLPTLLCRVFASLLPCRGESAMCAGGRLGLPSWHASMCTPNTIGVAIPGLHLSLSQRWRTVHSIPFLQRLLAGRGPRQADTCCAGDLAVMILQPFFFESSKPAWVVQRVVFCGNITTTPFFTR